MGQQRPPSTLWGVKMAQPGPSLQAPLAWLVGAASGRPQDPGPSRLAPPAAPQEKQLFHWLQQACSPSLPQGPLSGLLSLPGEMPGWRWRGQQAGAQGRSPGTQGPAGTPYPTLLNIEVSTAWGL